MSKYKNLLLLCILIINRCVLFVLFFKISNTSILSLKHIIINYENKIQISIYLLCVYLF